MGDVRITPQKILDEGITPALTGSLAVAATSEYIIRNTGRMFINVKKAGAGDCTVIIQTPITTAGLAVAEQSVTCVATSGDVLIGPFPPNVYNDAVGDITVTFSEVTGLTAGAFEL